MKHVKKNKYKFRIQHIGSIFWFAFSNNRIKASDEIDASSMELFKKMHASLLNKGIYLGPSGYEVGFVSSAHKRKDLKSAAITICSVLDEVIGK